MTVGFLIVYLYFCVFERCTVLQKSENRLVSLLLISVLTLIATTCVANQTELFINIKKLNTIQLVEVVLTRNPSVEAMQAAWQAEESQVEQVSALDDPRLTYTFAPQTRNQEGRDFGQSIQLSQQLPWPGKLSLRGDGARLEAQAAVENIELLQLRLIEAATHSFANWYYIHEALRINNINRGLWKEYKTVTKVKYSTGRSSKQNMLRAEVEEAMLEQQTIVLRRKKRNIQARINKLLNRLPDESVPPPAQLPNPQLLPNVRILREKALVSHPALKALNAHQDASQIKLKLAQYEYYPDFNITVGYNSLWDRDEKRFTVGVGINIPLGQDKRDAKVDESRSRTMQMKWKITDKQAEIVSAVQQAYNNVEESRLILALYHHKLLPLAKETLRAVKDNYRVGEGDFLDVVSANKELMDKQLSSIKVLTNYHRHLATLVYRVGDSRLLFPTFTKSIMTTSDRK